MRWVTIFLISSQLSDWTCYMQAVVCYAQNRNHSFLLACQRYWFAINRIQLFVSDMTETVNVYTYRLKPIFIFRHDRVSDLLQLLKETIHYVQTWQRQWQKPFIMFRHGRDSDRNHSLCSDMAETVQWLAKPIKRIHSFFVQVRQR